MTDEQLVRAAAEAVIQWPEWEDGLNRPEKIPYYHTVGGVHLCWANGTQQLWNPLTDEADCWQLVDKLAANGWYMRLQTWAGEWLCEMWQTNTDTPVHRLPIHSALGDRRCAIVLACLKAVGVDTEAEGRKP